MPVLAFAFLAAAGAIRVRHVLAVTAVGEAGPAPAGATRLIVPDHNNATFEWLDQTGLMLARHQWRLRHLDYENAPYGRDVENASPYRWWLGGLAAVDRWLTGRPTATALEQVALFADPLLDLVLFAGMVVWLARRFGGFVAAMGALGLALLFPFNAEFLPGMPDSRGLAVALAAWTALLLCEGVARAGNGEAGATVVRRRFIAAGIVGGLGLWISVAMTAPLIAGLALGGVLAATRLRGASAAVLPWRAWGAAGAATTLAACLLENFPSNLGGWNFREVHPLFGVAWFALAEVVHRVSAWIRTGRPGLGVAGAAAWLLALAGVAALPVAMQRTHHLGFLETDLAALRLARLPNGPSAPNLVTWITRDGFSPQVWATILPFLLLVPGVWLLWRRATAPALRAALGLALGAVVPPVVFAGWQLNRWSDGDAALLVLLVALTAVLAEPGPGPVGRWIWGGVCGLLFLPGAIQFFPWGEARASKNLAETEVYTLVERDLARWLAQHAGPRGDIVLAPYNQTYTLYYYGGFRGLATLGLDDLDGLTAAVRIVSASTVEEARELVDRRGVRYIVIPSWDGYLDAYARIGMGKVEDTFVNRLHYWRLPPWLRPVAYDFPTIAGFEGQSVAIFEVVEDQEDAVALSRLAEYFVDQGLLNEAARAAVSLRRFPADPSALVARAEVELARDDAGALAGLADQLQARLSGGADRALPWDRRVSLAIVLARLKQTTRSAEQVKRCLANVDEAGIRSLSPGALYRLQVLARAFHLEMADPRLRQLALDLLPAEMQARLR